MEAFQSAAAEAATNSAAGLPAESPLERVTYDDYEIENSDSLGPPASTILQPYDGSAALAEFDDNAPIPWDFDNRDSDPADILWGSVDTRCSAELRDRAKMRAIFSTGNNVEVTPDGALGYYSTKLNGKIFYDPAQIVAVKYAEFLIDTGTEEFIEWGLGKLAELAVGGDVKMMGEAAGAARISLDKEIANRKAQGLPEWTKSERKVRYNELEAENITKLKNGESVLGKNATGRSSKFMRRIEQVQDIISLGPVMRPVKRAIGDGLSRIRGAIRSAFQQASESAAGQKFRTLTRSGLDKLGTKTSKRILAKFAAKRAAIMAAKNALRRTILAPIYAIPIYGQIIAVIEELLNLMFLVVIPQVLADYADLDEDPNSASCDPGAFQGCPDSHPFNLRCAVSKAVGDAFWEFMIAIPLWGDAVGAFAPYICSASNLSATFRQSFRPPPYYFDSTLSIFFAEKPNILSGKPDGSDADPMYNDPGKFRLKPDSFPNRTSMYDAKNTSTSWGTHYHPWVDFSHTDMLDKMAQYYYEKAIKFAEVDELGFVTFQYIDQFKGLIASSQYSCDVQVTLKEMKFKAFTGEIADGYPKSVANPYETMESVDTGCSYHDRRFYFTWDFTKSGKPSVNYDQMTASAITEEVLDWLDGQTSASRMEVFRRMCVVVGCTNTNGTAADVVDVTPDGEPIADAPVGLGMRNQPYLPPKVNLPGTIELDIPKETDSNCGGFRSKLNHFGTRTLRPNSSTKTPSLTSSTDRIVSQSVETDYTAGLTETTAVNRRQRINLRTGVSGAYIVETISELSLVPTPARGDIVHVKPERKDYIYWDREWVNGVNTTIPLKWQVYNPTPVWSVSTNLPNRDTEWLVGTAKYWKEISVDRSNTQRWGTGIQGGLTAMLPLKFGLAGGFYATTMDAAGISSAIACTYQDPLNQIGNFVLNGNTVTSQTKFVIGRGSIILYAPGYTPTIQDRCGNFTVNHRICSNRTALRVLNKEFERTYASQNRRLNYLLSSRPDAQASVCTYAVNSVAIAPDGTEIPGSERTERVAIPYAVPANSSTCTMVARPGSMLIGLPTILPLSPLPTSARELNPPLKKVEYDLLATRPSIQRSADAACATYVNCASDPILNRIVTQFNTNHLMGYDTNGRPKYSIEMVKPAAADCKTPIMDSTYDANGSVTAAGINEYKGGLQGPVCVYNATFRVDKADGQNSTETVQSILTVSLKPTSSTTDATLNKCGYDLSTHDYPYTYYSAPLPKSSPFKFPRSTNARMAKLIHTAPECDKTLTDCSGATLIDRFVSQFNAKYNDRKILRVIRAYTPDISGGPFCDYEVDIQRRTKEVNPRSYTERDTMRMKVKPVATGCTWDLDTDGSDKRQTGTTINTETDEQVLVTPYLWPTSYFASVRDALNRYIAEFIPRDVPGTVDRATRAMRDKLAVLSRAIKANTIQGCATDTPGSTCKDEDTLTAFMNRYAFDCSPPYPSGQFGSTVRTIVGWRRAGLAGPLECHLELVEREETYPNWLIKQKDRANTTETARFYVRQYSFSIDSAGGNPCRIVPSRISSQDISGRSFDIAGKAYGIEDPGAVVSLKPGYSFSSPNINPFSLPVMDAMKRAADAYKPKANGYEKQIVTGITQALNARPNVIEYRVKITEQIKDPDFGLAINEGVEAIVVVTWDETKWNPVTGKFVGSIDPSTVLVFVPGRTFFRDRRVFFDGQEYQHPPYLFWPAPPYDPNSQETRVQDKLLTVKAASGGWSWTVKASVNAAEEQPWTEP